MVRSLKHGIVFDVWRDTNHLAPEWTFDGIFIRRISQWLQFSLWKSHGIDYHAPDAL